MNESNISPPHLTALGVLSLAYIHLHRKDFGAVSRVLSQLTAAQFKEHPYLYFVRGVMNFIAMLPVTEQTAALSGLPLDVRNARPIIGGQELSLILDASLNDLRQALPYAITLGLIQRASCIIELYIVWCELLHPTRKQAATEHLRREMDDHSIAISRVQYAFAHLDGYSPASLEAYLRRRDDLGGLNDEELRAAFVISLHKDKCTANLAALIAAKRQQAEASFGRDGILSLQYRPWPKPARQLRPKLFSKIISNCLRADRSRACVLKSPKLKVPIPCRTFAFV